MRPASFLWREEMAKHVATPVKGEKERDREYEIVELENGMQVALASDPWADKAACAVDVKVGSLLDDSDLPGLAHLLEHMLFFSSDRFPEEDAYRAFVTKNGGSTNAFTSSLDTCFFFDISPSPSCFENALDRFSSFLVSPTFQRDGVAREIHAVNNEAERNVTSETWRQLQVVKQHIKDDHPLRRYAVGDRKTLSSEKPQGVDVHERLLSFHRLEYGAERMRGAIFGRQPLSELRSLAERYFSNVPRCYSPERPYIKAGSDLLQRDSLVRLKPTTSESSLEFIWQIPPQEKFWRCNPASSFLGFLLGHESEGSLYFYLKQEQLASELVAGEHPLSYSDASLFSVRITLTERGKQSIEHIGEALFAYIRHLQQLDREKAVASFNERKRIAQLGFDYKPRPSASQWVVKTSMTMQYTSDDPAETLRVEDNVPLEYDDEGIKASIDSLTCESVLVVFVDNDLAEDANLSTEPHFGARYRTESLRGQINVEQWHSPNQSWMKVLHLPVSNEFLPSKFDMKGAPDNAQSKPERIHRDDMLTAFCQPDVHFRDAPKAACYLDLRAPFLYTSPSALEYGKLMLELLERTINSSLYHAQNAGLRASFKQSSAGITIAVRGFDDKLHKLYSLILDALCRLAHQTVDEMEFETVRHAEEKRLLDLRREHSYERALFLHSITTTEAKFDFESNIQAIASASASGLVHFVNSFLRAVSISVFAAGNVTPEETMSLAHEAKSTLQKEVRSSKPALDPSLPRMVVVPAGAHSAVKELHESEVEENSACLLSFQANADSHSFLRSSEHVGVVSELLARMLKEPLFAQLRTLEQLGYIVTCFSTPKHYCGTSFFVALVQSSECTAHYLHSRLRAFFKGPARHNIQQMSEERFKTFKDGLEAVKAEEPKDVLEQADEMWKEIYDNTHLFERREREISILRALTKEDVLAFFDEHLQQHKRCLAIKVSSQKHNHELEAEGEIGEEPARELSRSTVHRFRAAQTLRPSTTHEEV